MSVDEMLSREIPSPWSGSVVCAVAYVAGAWVAERNGPASENPWTAGSTRAQAWQAGYEDTRKLAAA